MRSRIFVGAGRDELNLRSALRHLDETRLPERLAGASVFIKANFVDPDCPWACTSPRAIFETAVWAAGHGAKKIFVGDDGCRGSQRARLAQGASEFSKYACDALGVPLEQITQETGVKAAPIELSSLKATEFEGIPLRDTRDFLVISLALPKIHGEYVFSGACKNMVGLVLPEERKNVVHPLQEFESTIKIKYFKQGGVAYEIGREASHTMRLGDQKKQANALNSLAKYAEQAGNFLLHIIDGSLGVYLHEFCGPVEKCDFAVAGTSALEVDETTYRLVGIPSGGVFYLRDAGEKPFGEPVGVVDYAWEGARVRVGREPSPASACSRSSEGQ